MFKATAELNWSNLTISDDGHLFLLKKMSRDMRFPTMVCTTSKASDQPAHMLPLFLHP